MNKTRREVIMDLICDTVMDLLYYDRKEDSVIGVGDIEDAITKGEITAEEIITLFGNELAVEPFA